MSIKARIFTALSTVLANSHAVELPRDPTFPAIVFDIDSTPEEGWCQGGGYDRHEVAVVILSASLADIAELKGRVKAAMTAVDGVLWDDGEGDADYEADPDVYGYYINFAARTPQAGG